MDHKTWVSGVFDRAALEYGEKNSSYFNDFGKRLVELSKVPQEKKALDVATGKGAVLFPLAEKIGHQGKVIGIDISSEMVRKSSEEAKRRQLDWVECHRMDAEQLNFHDSYFDYVFCGFGLFFFPSLLTALKEFKRVLKPGGTLAVSSWGDDSLIDKILNDEIYKFANKDSLIVTPLWNEASLQTFLNQAGFNEIQISKEVKDFYYERPEACWQSLWSHATRAKLEKLSEEMLRELHENFLQKVESLKNEKGIFEDLQVYYAFAKKPLS